MKNIAVTVIAIAAALFILNFAFTNYESYEDAKNATVAIEEDLPKYAYFKHFSLCSVRWADNPTMISECDAESVSGYNAFKEAWKSRATTIQQRISLMSCWRTAGETSGTDWALAGNCSKSITLGN